MRYPRSAGSIHTDHFGESHLFRSLNPAIAYKDLVVCAPSDSNRLFALDAFAGQLLWSSEEASDIVHLLGVGQDYLLASGERLYWFQIHDGQLRGQFPEPYRDAVRHARPQLRGYGRGILANDLVYWPTRDAIYVFRQRPLQTETGWMPVLQRAPIDLHLHQAHGGNLAVAGNVLLVATPDELIALGPHGGRR